MLETQLMYNRAFNSLVDVGGGEKKVCNFQKVLTDFLVSGAGQKR